MLVFTKNGLIERDQLTVKDIIEEQQNARVTATEWYLGEELVRRDVNVNLLRGLEMGAEQQSI
jgi:hypothetical protein